MARIKPISPNLLLTDPSYRPFALAIGQAAIGWNNLHEALRCPFSEFFVYGNTTSIHAIWHSLRSDRTQRGLLDTAVKASYSSGVISNELMEKIKWLLSEANKLAEVRDNVVHTPLTATAKGGPSVAWSAHHGHPRA